MKEKKTTNKLKTTLIICLSLIAVGGICGGITYAVLDSNSDEKNTNHLIADFGQFFGSRKENFDIGKPAFKDIKTTAYRYQYDYNEETFVLKHKVFDGDIEISEVQPLPGTFINDDPIKGIYKIDINYVGKGKLSWDTYRDFRNNNSAILEGNSYSIEFKNDRPCYFKIETNGENLQLDSLEILNNPKTGAVHKGYSASGYNQYRISAPKSGNEMPTDVVISKDHSSYETKATKTYDAESEYKDLTSCVNQIMLFGLDSSSLFVNNRNGYDREDGYILAFNGKFVKQTYYEFDIPLGKAAGRGAGRFVLFPKGVDSLGYNSNEPLIVFTDDHYLTFQEYLNYGIDGKAVFGPRFKAEGLLSGTTWTPSTTIGVPNSGTINTPDIELKEEISETKNMIYNLNNFKTNIDSYSYSMIKNY